MKSWGKILNIKFKFNLKNKKLLLPIINNFENYNEF